MIVLDTNVVSELAKPVRSEAVTAWAVRHPMAMLYTTTITMAEMFYGIAILEPGRRRMDLRTRSGKLFDELFAGRVLSFDTTAAEMFAEIVASRRRNGRPISTFDAQIAAIARSRGAAVATRNVGDFADCGITVLDPWKD